MSKKKKIIRLLLLIMVLHIFICINVSIKNKEIYFIKGKIETNKNFSIKKWLD